LEALQVGLDKISLRLIQSFIKAGKSARALDAALRLRTDDSLNVAIILAQKGKNAELAERIDLLRQVNIHLSYIKE
jgi:hypothetical protein